MYFQDFPARKKDFLKSKASKGKIIPVEAFDAHLPETPSHMTLLEGEVGCYAYWPTKRNNRLNNTLNPVCSQGKNCPRE
jgi:hypothetical protein